MCRYGRRLHIRLQTKQQGGVIMMDFIVGAATLAACLLLIVGYAFMAEHIVDYIRRNNKERKEEGK